MWLGTVLAFYHLFLIERKRSFILEREPFLLPYHLGVSGKGLVCVLIVFEIVLLLATASVLLLRIARPLLGRFCWIAVAAVSAGYFGLVTFEYHVLLYLTDGIQMAVLRQLGGGNVWSALAYVRSEFSGLLPLAVAALGFSVVITWFFLHARRRGWAVSGGRRIERLLTPKRLLLGNLLMAVAAPACGLVSFPVHWALNLSSVHRLYTLPGEYLTDFDGDGYSLFSSPPDFAPLDRSRHPYALEIPGNQIDEDGVGGDLPSVILKPNLPAWDPAKLRRRNVLLIVMESARADLLDSDVDGQPVMPVLRSLPGQRLRLFSHAGFTGPSLFAMLNGSLLTEGTSLIDRFKALGYRTGVFSGQAEDFGNTAALCHMRNADSFIDATSFPKKLRMQTSTDLASLSVPARVVNAKFVEWCRRGGGPFFAYLNWQEMHFPYDCPGEPHPLVAQPVKRGEISPTTRERLLRTYWNSARIVDQALGEVISLLDELGIREQTLLLVAGDHGEALFDNGYLGHGTNVSYEQNAALGKLINSEWTPPAVPVGSVSASTIIYNGLLRHPEDALPLESEVLCYTGTLQKPEQLGLFTPSGLTRYSFSTGLWSRQLSPGSPFLQGPVENRMIHEWESLLLSAVPSPNIH